MKKLFLFCSLLAAAALPALTVVKDGKSDYVIVVSPKAEKAAHAAAADLQEYIHKATGAKLPKVKEANVGKRPAFRLGYNKVTVSEGFEIQVKGKDIYISGDDTPGDPYNNHWSHGSRVGTWYGAVDFLEKYLGIRWFMPGPLGEYVPKSKNLIIPDNLNFKDAPRMAFRWSKQVGHGKRSKADRMECWKWRRRNREGQTMHWCSWHSWVRHLQGKDYFKDHPEWFAYVGGRRYNHNHLGHGMQICTTNPGALDEFAKNLFKAHANYKHIVMMSITPNDGGFFCECKNCQALDNGVRPDGSRIMTDRIATYANEMAKRITKINPKQTLGLLAYSVYADGVGKVKLHPNVYVMEVLNDAGLTYYSPEVRRRHLANLKAWRKNLKLLTFDTWTEGMGNLGLPVYQFRNICHIYDNLAAADVGGVCINNTSDFASAGLNHYFYMKFAWAPVKDREKLYNEAIAQCYGPAAFKCVKAYFEDVEKRMEKFALGAVDFNREMGYAKRYPGVLTKVYPGLYEKWYKPLSAVAKKVTDKGQRARLQLILDNLEYTKTTCDLYDTAIKVTRSKNASVALAAKGDKLARLRDKQVAKNYKLPSAGPVNFANTEKNFALPLKRDIFSFLLSSNARKSTKVERRNSVPVLDGKFNEDFWKNLPVMTLEVDAYGVKQPVGSTLKIAVTKDALYLAVHNPEPLMDQVKDSAVKPGSSVWLENYVDLFFHAADAGSSYHQLMFNTLGTPQAFFYKNGKGTPWEHNAKIAVHRTKTAWDAEVMIPLKSLTKSKDIRGDIWGFNICRDRRVVKPVSGVCWSPTFGGFHNVQRFGKLIIK